MQIIVFSYKYNGPLKPLVGEADIVHLPVSTRGKASKEKTIKGLLHSITQIVTFSLVKRY